MILPGAAVGVLGGGQLGRMFALAARRMGYRVHVLAPDEDSPTGQVADLEVRAAYDDLDAVKQFALGVDVITLEFENVSSQATAAAEKHVPVRPGPLVLHTAQNRLREKTFLQQTGLPVPSFAAIRSQSEIAPALDRIGLPAVLKTAAWGYDGKGQTLLRRREEAPAAWKSLGEAECILEQFVNFQSELSVVAARGMDRHVEVFDPLTNHHENHILDLSYSPSELNDAGRRRAVEIARTVMEKLEVVGVLCVELFWTGGELLINELAPRPHNSGHLTIDAHVTCQFEQQLRAVCGLPLGSTRMLRPAAMANLLGDLWTPGEPHWKHACGYPDVKLHLYGKQQPRRGRKMGHLTALADTAAQAVDLARSARQSLLVD